MLAHLLESRPRPARRPAATVLSALAHVAVVALAVAGTRIRPVDAAPDERAIVLPLVPPPAEPPPAPAPPSPRDRVASPPRDGMPPLPPPPGFDVGIPPVDVNAPPTMPDALGPLPRENAVYSGSGAAGASERIPGSIFSAEQVERPVLALAGNPAPRYPEMLRRGGIEGRVVAQFVVDSAGHVEPGSVRVLESGHELFAASVRAAVGRMRFTPAQAGGRRVRQLVQQSFVFAIGR